ncbi:hypothetical protein G6F50_017286 [Rhizopus delemar]|uniref:Aminotransferase class V domain-containing protein n=1 Tax=Rhizopus delemar TaxID=936053 RepID=A0A9P7C0E4_9FUNG|nr:hypothetical protein G6F50_017286 [Rhizopus delemar]
MNIPFFLPDADLDARFVAEAKAAGLLALKGHKVVGGIRASLYNAMPLAGAEALVAFMADFQQRHGAEEGRTGQGQRARQGEGQGQGRVEPGTDPGAAGVGRCALEDRPDRP